MIEVSLFTVNVAERVPKYTVVAPVNKLPVMVTTVPPDTEPDVGEMLVTTGGR